MDLQELLTSEEYIKDGSAIDFKSPKFYLDPFIDAVGKLGENFTVEATNRVANRTEESGKENIAYGRFKLELKTPTDFDREDSYSTIGIVVALDNAKPVMKVYSGQNVYACLNLTIFNPDYVYASELTGNSKSVYTKAAQFVNEIQQSADKYFATVRSLKDTMYSGNSLNELTGKLVRSSMRNSKLGHTVIIQGTRELDNPKSVYYAKGGETSAWNYYNSITENLKTADVLDRPSKTLLLSDLFLGRN